MMGGLADGELLERVPEGKQGAFGRLGDNVNQTSDRLLETVENIRDTSNTISSSVKELRHGKTVYRQVLKDRLPVWKKLHPQWKNLLTWSKIMPGVPRKLIVWQPVQGHYW